MNTNAQILEEWEKREAYNQSRYEYLRRIVAWFNNRGWRSITPNGIYAAAVMFSPCGKMVCKIADSESHDGWPLYALWAARQGSPHVPKFYTVRSLRYGWFLGIMEKLEKLPIYSYYDLEGDWARDTLNEDDYRVCIEASLVDRAARQAYYELGSNKQSWRAEANRIMSKTLRAFTFALIQQFKAQACDTHEGNLMVRRTPSGPVLVANDPYGSRGDER